MRLFKKLSNLPLVRVWYERHKMDSHICYVVVKFPEMEPQHRWKAEQLFKKSLHLEACKLRDACVEMVVKQEKGQVVNIKDYR